MKVSDCVGGGDGRYAPRLEACHYNVQYKNGPLYNRVTARDFAGVDPETIEWVWIGEMARKATETEVSDLCSKGKL